MQRLAVLVAYEATKDLELAPAHVQTPLAVTSGQVLDQRIGLIPILRAGLGMVDPVLNLIPGAEVWHLGVYRDEKTATPVEYYSRIQGTTPVDVALVLDPMLATGGSAVSALATLKEWGVPQVKLLALIAAREGIDEVFSQFPIRKYTYVPSTLIERQKIYCAWPRRCRGPDFQHATGRVAWYSL